MSRIVFAAVLVAGSLPFVSTGAGATEAMEHPMTHYHRLHHHMRHDRIHANGLCNGRSHGTGYHGCGTATGGPVGGLPSRN